MPRRFAIRLRDLLVAAGQVLLPVLLFAAERALRENVSADAEEERLDAAYEKLVRRLGQEQREKIVARLLRQGFELGAVRNYVRYRRANASTSAPR